MYILLFAFTDMYSINKYWKYIVYLKIGVF
jgi:hypothetical protein